MRLRLLGSLLIALLLAGCEYEEVTREIGYKGKARLDPWLAAERFAEQSGHTLRMLNSWTAPQAENAVCLVAASILSNESFTRQMKNWVSAGGHLIVMIEHAEVEGNDWSESDLSHTPVPEPVKQMLESLGVELNDGISGQKVKSSEVKLDGDTFAVAAESWCSVAAKGDKPSCFVSLEAGDGRLTVVTDARIFRNRWIGNQAHAALLDQLLLNTNYDGDVLFLKGSQLSLWSLLNRHLWPILCGLGAFTLLWLWRNFARFGPIDTAVEPAMLRGYDHHLEALGDFQWRLDRAAGLLTPLRAQIVERGQRVAMRTGQRDQDFFQFLSDRAGLSRERVQRALTEGKVPDSAILTRTTADLQRLLQVLH